MAKELCTPLQRWTGPIYYKRNLCGKSMRRKFSTYAWFLCWSESRRPRLALSGRLVDVSNGGKQKSGKFLRTEKKIEKN